MCHYEANIWSEAIEFKKLNANAAAVVGRITAGICYYQLEEQCAALNIACMSEKLYIKYREELVDDFQEVAMDTMTKAAEVEKQLTLEKRKL